MNVYVCYKKLEPLDYIIYANKDLADAFVLGSGQDVYGMNLAEYKIMVVNGYKQPSEFDSKKFVHNNPKTIGDWWFNNNTYKNNIPCVFDNFKDSDKPLSLVCYCSRCSPMSLNNYECKKENVDDHRY